MAGLRLSFACGPYDRTQALSDETIRPEGIELKYIAGQPAELFWRMLQYQEFDISEMSMSNYISLVGAGDFAVHRHSGFSVTRLSSRIHLRQHQ